MMNLIKFKYRYDFGHEWYVMILNTGRHLPKFIKNRSVIQMSVSWNDCPGWPYLQITSGANGIFSFMFWVYKFGFDFDLLASTWNFDRLEQLEDES